MKIVRLLKPLLFFYELIRVLILAVILLLNTNGNNIFGQLVYITPNALFPLMALFIWLNQERYGAYLPLFLAGKCIAISTTLVFSIISGQTTILNGFMNFEIFLGFDLMAAGVVLLINNDNKKNSEVKAIVNVDDTEGKKICE